MTAMPAEKPRKLIGAPRPRLSPPWPARSTGREIVDQARDLDIDFYPWQRAAVHYAEALGRGSKWLYGEVAWIVGRQNGKTEILVPLITKRIRRGRRVMHTAQDRALPREVFERVADIMQEKYRDELRRKPRLANGTERIDLKNGGVYRIVAPSRSGARGPANDDVILDEVREQATFDFIAAAKPTLAASKNPQFIYLSNAGEDDSIVLNAIRDRRDTDPRLAYLEWSAEPTLAADDELGWAMSNPSLGHDPGKLSFLRDEYRTNELQHTMSHFETEYLCRWVASMREPLVSNFDWQSCNGDTGREARPVLAVNMAPEGRRASVVAAWRNGEAYSVREVIEATGNPIDTDALGEDVKAIAGKLGAQLVGYDPMTDLELAKYLRKGQGKPITGQEFANASAQFVNLVTARALRWSEGEHIATDLGWTSRKPDSDRGTYHAVRAQDDRPITASLAAIRAVWLASGKQDAKARIM